MINENNGYIYGEKNDTKYSSILWVKGKRVINGEWDLIINPDGTATVPYGDRPTLGRVMPAPAGTHYDDVLNEARDILIKKGKVV